MSRELVYRMRTCAAALVTREADPPLALMRDAIDCLLEASNLLETPLSPQEAMERLNQPEEPAGEPMEVLTAAASPPSIATWGGDLPSVAPRPCPACGDISARMVRRAGRKLIITCPVCEEHWEYGR